MAGKKCTKEEKDRRVEEASIWLVENPDASWTDFMNVYTVKWDLTRDVCNKYRKLALSKVGQTSSEDIDTAKRLAQASLQRMLKMAMDEKDVRLAFQIRQEINKVTGALAPVRTEVVQKEDRKIFQVNIDQDQPLKKVE